MHNGKYPNEWIDEGQELKYFMKSVKVGTQEQFKRQYKDNSAIINSVDTPIYVFIKNNTDLKLEGIFSYVDDHTEPDDSKWFRLRKRDVLNMSTSMTMKEYDKQLSKEVAFSSSLSSQERLRRIALQLREPQRIKVITTQYKRSSDVIVEALLRANGVCEICGNSAPFKKASDGSPYLEVHHVLPLSQGGADILENVLAICPNCHRKEHFG